MKEQEDLIFDLQMDNKQIRYSNETAKKLLELTLRDDVSSKLADEIVSIVKDDLLII